MDSTRSRLFQSKCILPPDILDNIFHELLPPLGPPNRQCAGQSDKYIRWSLNKSLECVSGQPSEIPAYPDESYIIGDLGCCYDPPIDLMHCRLICRMFARLATRWIWRRLNFDVTYGNPYQSKRESEICAFLEAHPNIGNYIRFLTIHTDNTPAPPWHRIVPLLTNLRVLSLRVHAADLVPADIIYGLLSGPFLHTVLFVGARYLSLSPPPTYAVKRLYVDYIPVDPGKVLFPWSSIPLLENLYSFDIPPPDIPWHLLKQFAMSTASGCIYELVESFKSWKQSDPARSSPLTELNIFNGDPIPVQIILETFGGQALTMLRLTVESMTASLLNGIVMTFPHLQALALDDSYDLSEWNGDLTEYANVLGKLQFLKFLQWNYVTPSNRNNEGDTILCCVEMIQVVSRHCPGLLRINFAPFDEDYSALNFSLMRDDTADDGGSIVLPRCYRDSKRYAWYPYGDSFTTAWKISNFPDV